MKRYSSEDAFEDAAKKSRSDPSSSISAIDLELMLSGFDFDLLAPLSPSGSDGTTTPCVPETPISVPPAVASSADLQSPLPELSSDDAQWLDALLASTDSTPLTGLPAITEGDTLPPLPASAFSSCDSSPVSSPPQPSSAEETLSAVIDTESRSCLVCGKRFAKCGDLKRHALIHTQVRAYRCERCPRAFTLKGDLKRHIAAVHEHDRPFQCDQCSRSFPLRAQLRRHAVTHSHERPYECDVCQKRFTQSGDVARHKRSHVDERRFPCDRCGTAFLQKAHLTAHQRSRNCTATESKKNAQE
jgi:uncharacterized Zn-finger protein